MSSARDTWAAHLTTLDLAARCAHAGSQLTLAVLRGDADMVTLRLIQIVRHARAIGTQYDLRLVEDFDALEDAMRHELCTEAP